MARLVEYSCSDEHICDCNCPNKDCVHNKINKREENYYERDHTHSKHQMPGDRSSDQ